MGRDRIVAPELNEVHPRFGTPYRAIAITGGLILLFIVAGNVELLATLGSVLHLLIYGLLNVELIVFIEPTVIAISDALVGAAVLWYFGDARSRTEAMGERSAFILSRRDRMPDAAVSAATSVKPDGGDYRVMAPLANPEHEEDYHAVLDQAQKDAETFGVAVETHTIVSHRGFDPGHIVVPTRGGPGSAYAAEIAALLRDEYSSEITLMHVTDSDETAEAEDFLGEWASGIATTRSSGWNQATSPTVWSRRRQTPRWSSSAHPNVGCSCVWFGDRRWAASSSGSFPGDSGVSQASDGELCIAERLVLQRVWSKPSTSRSPRSARAPQGPAVPTATPAIRSRSRLSNC